jgi:hypothetical protein
MNIVIMFIISLVMGYTIEEKKEIVQKIIDKHLSKDVNFSVDSLEEDSLNLLIQYLIENDVEKKKSLRNKMLERAIESSKELNVKLIQVQELSEKIEIIPSYREKLEKSE